MNINKDKKSVELWKPKVGKKVKVWGNTSKTDFVIGVYIAKHIEIAMHYILLDGEDNPKPFHIFEFDWVS
jgi:hypothetical protein